MAATSLPELESAVVAWREWYRDTSAAKADPAQSYYMALCPTGRYAFRGLPPAPTLSTGPNAARQQSAASLVALAAERRLELLQWRALARTIGSWLKAPGRRVYHPLFAVSSRLLLRFPPLRLPVCLTGPSGTSALGTDLTEGHFAARVRDRVAEAVPTGALMEIWRA